MFWDILEVVGEVWGTLEASRADRGYPGIFEYSSTMFCEKYCGGGVFVRKFKTDGIEVEWVERAAFSKI